MSDPDNLTFNMLTSIFGENPASRLFQSVSQRKGLAYNIGAQHEFNNNIGALYIYGNVQSKNANEAIDAIFEEMNLLKNELVPTEELDALKKQNKYDFAKHFESNQGHLSSIQLNINYGITPEHTLKKLNEVTPEAIREAARKYFPTDRATGNYVLSLRDPLKK